MGFHTANGSSYINVTLVTERTSGKINSWRLIRDLVTTSHALLETLVGRGSAEEHFFFFFIEEPSSTPGLPRA